MQTISSAQFRRKLSSIINKVGNTNVPITITRKNNQPIVLLSLKGYQAIEKIFEAIEDPCQLYLDIMKIEDDVIRQRETDCGIEPVID